MSKTKILVVSDNFELCSFFKKEFNRQKLGNYAYIDYAYSITNKSSSDMRSLGAIPVDVKDPNFVFYAISSYVSIISIHCKQIFPEKLVETVQCINLHPGYNPHNRGWYPQVFSIINKLPSGATLHIMDSKIDHGPIIAQKTVTIEDIDTSLDVYLKIISTEKDLIRENLASLIHKTYTTFCPLEEGNYNSIDDFRGLCSLDMDSVGTLHEHIDLLRALTHGDHSNSYFIDKNGRKVYVSIKLEAT